MPAHLSGIQQEQEDRMYILDLEQGKGSSGTHSPAFSLYKWVAEIQSDKGTCLKAHCKLIAELRYMVDYIVSSADGPTGPRL